MDVVDTKFVNKPADLAIGKGMPKKTNIGIRAAADPNPPKPKMNAVMNATDAIRIGFIPIRVSVYHLNVSAEYRLIIKLKIENGNF